MAKYNKDLNGFLTTLLGLSIFAKVLRYILSLSDMISFIANDGYGTLIWSTISTVVIVTSIVGILMKKTWGVYMLFGWGAIVLLSEIICPDFFAPNTLMHDFLIFAFWGGLFFLKSNGQTAWSVLLNKETDEESSDEVQMETLTIENTQDEIENPNNNQKSDEGTLEESSINKLFVQALASNSNQHTTDPITNANQSENDSSTIKESLLEPPEEKNDAVIGNETANLANSSRTTEGSVVAQSENNDYTNETSYNDTNEQKSVTNFPSNNNNHISKKNIKIIVCCISLILIITGVCLAIWYADYNSQEKRFQRANQFFSEGHTTKAVELFNELASEDYVNAKTRLGSLYLFNDSINLDSENGIRLLKEAAASDTSALEKLMYIYNGYTCKGKDFTNYESAKYYANLAIKRNVLLNDANFVLGCVYSEENDNESAFYYWEKAAQGGMAGAYDNLGWMAYYGNGCKQNYQRAYDYFKKALEIDSDDDYALFYMGLFCLYGNVLPKDYMQAKSYFKRSANLGNEDARKEYSKLQMN